MTIGEHEINYIREISKRLMGNDFAHGYPHVLRVLRYAHLIVLNENIDIDKYALDASIYLHDVGRVLGEPHALYSSWFAQGLLSSLGIDQATIKRIINAILYHSYSYAREKRIVPESPVALVLSDADKLDALGAIGFLRMFHYSWKHGRSLEETIKHYNNKISVLPDLMHYNYSRILAKKLVTKTKQIIEWLLDETNI